MPSSRSSSPAPVARAGRPSSPETPTKSATGSHRSSSPKPTARLRDFGRRLTSSFRRDSRASISDIIASDPTFSRPASPSRPGSIKAAEPAESNEVLSAQAPKEDVEAPAALTAEPASIDDDDDASHPVLSSIDTDAQHIAPEHTALSPVAEVSSAITDEPQSALAAAPALELGPHTNAAVDEPEAIQIDKLTVDGIEEDEKVEEKNEPEQVHAQVEVQEPASMPEPVVPEAESPVMDMPVPELHHQESNSTFPVPAPATDAVQDAENPFSTPSTRHESLADAVHVVQFNDPQYQQDSASQLARAQGGSAWDVPIPATATFDQSAFDKLVDDAIRKDFAEKYAESLRVSSPHVPEHLTLLLRAAARLLADDDSIIGESRGMPIPNPAKSSEFTNGSTYHSQGSSALFPRPEESPISNFPPSTSIENHRFSNDMMQDTLQRLARVTSQPATLLIPQWNEHRLPDGSLYWSRPISYDLPMLLLVTDIDLRETGALGRVENFLARSTATSGDELEGAMELGQERDIWLAFSSPFLGGTGMGADPKGKGKATSLKSPVVPGADHAVGAGGLSVSPVDPTAFKIVMVDHAKRAVLPHIENQKQDPTEDEVSFSLAQEHSYWQFVESHPAHRNTSERDRDEAMDFLAWCLADQLVMSEGEQSNYPFSLSQSRELIELIRSTDVDGASSSRSTMIKTRVVAKVSLRNVAWRQALYASAKEEINGVLVEAPATPASPTAITVQPPKVPQVNQGVVKTGLRMMVSKMLGYA